MKKTIFSPRLIEHLLGLLALAMLSSGLLIYAYQEPDRITSAQAAQLSYDLDEAMTLYAENCAVCHGLAGDGIGSIPALDNPDLRDTDVVTLEKIISRGLYGTAMPAWDRYDGGPLSDYQIDTLVTLIQSGNWQEVQDRVVNLGLAPLVPFTAEADPLLLAQVATMPGGDLLAMGVEVYALQCVACHGADGLGTSLAPALNDPAVREKDLAEVERTILNGVSGTLMAAWGNVLQSEDLTALLELVSRWDEIPTGTIPEPNQPIPVTAESLALGADLYAQSCSRCHGPEGQGTQRAPALNVIGFLTDISDQAIQQIVTLGVPGTAMPAWGDRLTDAQIQAVVGFIRSWEATAPAVAEPARASGGPWWATAGNTPAGRGGKVGNTNNPADLSGVDPTLQNNLVPTQGAEPTPGTEPTLAASATSVNQTGQGQGAGGKTGGDSHTGGSGGPPWAQAEPVLPWWQKVDWRIIVLIGGASAISLALMLPALWVLRKMPAVSKA